LKILWFSNRSLTSTDSGGSGSWLSALVGTFLKNQSLQIFNITHGTQENTIASATGNIREWQLNIKAIQRNNELPEEVIIHEIIQIVDSIKPDIVHIWGIEGYWGLLSSHNYLKYPILLSTQGIKSAIARCYTGDLTNREVIKCIGLKELIRRRTPFQERKEFINWGRHEAEILNSHSHIAVQSEWVASYVSSASESKKIYFVDHVLQDAFLRSQPWKYHGNPILFCSSAYPAIYKGLHVAVRVTANLKKRFPHIRLRIAGPHVRPGIRRNGYITWIQGLIREMKLNSSVDWIGSIDANQTTEELRNCSVFLQPSFCESYSVSLAEAMSLGVPSVVSFAGGMSTLAKDEETALFFSPGDDVMAAHQAERLFNDYTFSSGVSERARQLAIQRHNPDSIANQHLRIYKEVIEDYRGNN
jgi:glycosyltransferase involved in cell wall biosynthesis